VAKQRPMLETVIDYMDLQTVQRQQEKLLRVVLPSCTVNVGSFGHTLGALMYQVERDS
jgi:hypothetical protein